MNFAAAARNATQQSIVVDPAPVASSEQPPPQTKPKQAKRHPKRAAVADAETSPSPAPLPVSTPPATGWKPKRAATAAASAATVVSPSDLDSHSKVRLPAGLSAASTSGIRFGGPRSTPASSSAGSALPTAVVESDAKPASHVPATNSTDVNGSLPITLPPGIPPNFYYFYNFMQPGMQAPPASGMMQPDYGLASAGLYNSAHQQPLVEQSPGQPQFSGMNIGSYPSQSTPYGAYAPSNLPAQYPQMGLLPPMGLGMPMNLLAGAPQAHPLQYQSMGQPGATMQHAFIPAVPSHGPSPGVVSEHSSHHHSALHSHAETLQGNGLPQTQASAFGPGSNGVAQDQHSMMMHPYPPMLPPYAVAPHVQHNSDLFHHGPNALFEQQQQQAQAQPGQQHTHQHAGPQHQQAHPSVSHSMNASVPAQHPYPNRSYVVAAQSGKAPQSAYPWGQLNSSTGKPSQ